MRGLMILVLAAALGCGACRGPRKASSEVELTIDEAESQEAIQEAQQAADEAAAEE